LGFSSIAARWAIFNAQITDKFKVSARWVVTAELGVISGLGFTMMQIGEWAAAVALWVVVGFLLLVKSLTWSSPGPRWLNITLRIASPLSSIVLCVLLIMITSLRKPDAEPWTNLAKVHFKKPNHEKPTDQHPNALPNFSKDGSSSVSGMPNNSAISPIKTAKNPQPRNATKTTKQESPKVVLTPYILNLKRRAIDLSNDVMRDPLMHGYHPMQGFAYTGSYYPTVMPDPPISDHDQLTEWNRSRVRYFAMVELKNVRQLRDEFGQPELHIRNPSLDNHLDSLSDPPTQQQLEFMMVFDIEDIAIDLRELASELDKMETKLP
jgi:hypothetical protein